MRKSIYYHQKKLKPQVKFRLVLASLIVLILPVLIIFCGYKKVVSRLDCLSQREQEWVKTKVEIIPRGQIYARNGEILASNCKRYKVLLELKKAYPYLSKVKKISKIINQPEQRLLNNINRTKKRLHLSNDSVFPIEIARNVTPNQAALIKMIKFDENGKNKDSGIYLSPYYTRYYPFGDRLAAKIIGFISYSNKKIELDPKDPTIEFYQEKESTGLLAAIKNSENSEKDKVLSFTAENYVIGRDGIEYSLDNKLSGDLGLSKYRGDGKRNPIPGTINVIKESIPGEDITLTIDVDIQTILEAEVKQIEAQFNPKYALIAVMDPKTGELLGSACSPTFDPNVGIQNPQNWFMNPLTQLAVEPGSVFKPLVLATFLEKGWATVNDEYYCGVKLDIESYKISEAEDSHAANAFLNLDEIITRSSNIGMAQLMMGIGQDVGGNDLSRHTGTKRVLEIKDMWKLNQPTGIELPWENPGLVRKGSIKLLHSQVYPYIELANFGFGQGVKVTPIQLLRAYCAFANGGYLVQPTVILDPNRPPKPLPRILSPEVARTMKEILIHVVESPHGTGKRAQLPEFRVAGKTGTAQVWTRNGYSKDKYISSFIGFFPAEHPKYTILVMVWYPQGGQIYGGAVAAPSFARVAKRIGYLKHLEPRTSPNSSKTPNKTASTPLAFFTPSRQASPQMTSLAAPLYYI